ncbi:carboxypeptidase-like regulatory domain-containing protein [Pedobacter sp. G11]|uniref:carboxypeptidase-like regulatory domain-containing protein n=1 Tax=Pedobacter sp. G11 TaxID=2482728 RepID=UPI001FEEE0E7|nr:carboxypeptidase-like regulatory domain-containing protein [Pedobacter sp. G11]
MTKALLYIAFLLSIYSCPVIAQNRIISGTVKEAETNLVLPGVTVSIAGTTKATTTDKNGYYEIAVTDNAAFILFSAVGMIAYKEPIGSKTSINVLLKADSRQLSEVIINAIGVETQRDKFGSSVSTVKGAAIASSGETSLLTGISSKVSGVLITRNGGDPGSGGYIQIRGQNTINGNAQPLFIFFETLLLVFLSKYWTNVPFLYSFIIIYRWVNAFAKIGVFAIAMQCCSKKVSASQFTFYMTIGALGSMVGAALIAPVKSFFSWEVSFALFALMMLMSAFLLRLLNFNKLEQQISDMAEIDAEEKYRTTNSDAWQMSKP